MSSALRSKERVDVLAVKIRAIAAHHDATGLRASVAISKYNSPHDTTIVCLCLYLSLHVDHGFAPE